MHKLCQAVENKGLFTTLNNELLEDNNFVLGEKRYWILTHPGGQTAAIGRIPGFSYKVLTQFQTTAKRKFFKETEALNTMLIPSYQKKYKDKKKKSLSG